MSKLTKCLRCESTLMPDWCNHKFFLIGCNNFQVNFSTNHKCSWKYKNIELSRIVFDLFDLSHNL